MTIIGHKVRSHGEIFSPSAYLGCVAVSDKSILCLLCHFEEHMHKTVSLLTVSIRPRLFF